MKLKKFVINSGGKFNPAKNGPVVIDFSKSKMVGATGDEAAGKSTLLDLFLMACGQNGGTKVVEALKNKDNDEIDVDLSFVGNDKSDYEVKVKDGRLTIKKDGEKQSSPGELIREQLGIVGANLSSLKNADIDTIVKELSKFSPVSPEQFNKKMKEFKDGQKKAKETRATANKGAKGAGQFLYEEGYADDKGELIEKAWVEAEKKYAKEPDIADLSKKLKAAGDKSDKFIENKSKVTAQKERKTQIEQQMKALQKELDTTNDNIAIGEKWLTANETVQKDYDAIRKQYDNAAKDVADYNKWQIVKQKKTEKDEYEQISIRADKTEKDLIAKQQELQWEVIPDIAGLEIILTDTHEDEGEQKKAGFYIKGMSSAQMSATEWLTAIIKILKKNKVPVLVIDDASQFGTSLMKTLEDMVKQGCYVLYAEMHRGVQELEFEYK